MRKRLMVAGRIAAATGALVLGVIGLHALIGTDETWSAPIGAASTLALVAITAWYAYTAHNAPRRAADEAMIREVGRFVARHRHAVWTATGFFPVGDPPPELPSMDDLFKSRDALREIRDQMLEFQSLLVRDKAVLALSVAAYALDAEEELHALAAAILDANLTAQAVGQELVTWEAVKAAHLAASGDPDRRQRWLDLLAGARVKAFAGRWEELSAAISHELNG